MIGIAFYGYMIGIFQTLFAAIETKNQFEE